MFYEDEFVTTNDNGIVISAYQELLNEKVAGDEFCWGYYLRIENNSNNTINLLGKNISITDTKGHSVSVDYEGFNGESPTLEPGEVFEFEDYATSKSSAVLYGCCKISSDANKRIQEIKIPALSLIANDNSLRVYN
ncbi:MAG: ApaG domain [Alphaproteobacteria bacterium]|nr:ApaG domain [Alphaproteobacteria bacterium]